MHSKVAFILMMFSLIYSQAMYVDEERDNYSLSISYNGESYPYFVKTMNKNVDVKNLSQLINYSIISGRATFIGHGKVELGVEFGSGTYSLVDSSSYEDISTQNFGFGINFQIIGPNSPFNINYGGKYIRTTYESEPFSESNITLESDAGLFHINVYEPIFQQDKFELIPFFNFNIQIINTTITFDNFGIEDNDESHEETFMGTAFGLGIKYDNFFIQTELSEVEGLSNTLITLGVIIPSKTKKPARKRRAKY